MPVLLLDSPPMLDSIMLDSIMLDSILLNSIILVSIMLNNILDNIASLFVTSVSSLVSIML